ncbi:ABC transporter ATP-binding protein [Luteipulveratus mongoliensis]|uniref:Multidrug ABC transporter permease n=1 Tax=Luteipulveratus mongoliensis TaxID=571913 RepID=A0A0K1JGP2_9MICO|nr:ABC transporter ATP-binding protein [Luteipulveratus mongoliensis]AKU15884.1 multidrug ABC transporter permease [Luteipulveratus mongoliensis]
MSAALLPIADRRTTVRLTRRLLSTHRRATLGAVLAFALAGLAAMVPPWLLGRIVDDVRRSADSADVITSAVAIAVAAVLGAVFSGLAVALLARAGEPALAELREDVLERTLHLDAATVEQAGTGDLLSRVGDDVRTVTTALNEVIPLLVSSVVAVGFTAIGLFALDWRLGLAGLVTVPFYVLGLRWYLPRSAPLYREERVAQGERAGALVVGFQAASTVRAFGTEDLQRARIEDASGRTVGIALNVFGLLTRFLARNNRAEMIGLLSISVTGFFLVREEWTSVGAVTAAALYFHRLFNPIGALLFMFDEVQSTGASLSRLAGVATIPQAEPARAEPPSHPGSLCLEDVEHAYVPGQPVLRRTTITLAAGERVALVGASGAGKTTLGAIAAGVLAPSTGRVTLAGTSYDDLGSRAVRDRISLVSQEIHVFTGTVRESLTLARPDASDNEVQRALESTFAWPWVKALPDGLDTVVGEHGHPLTAAQSQQLALARVALADPWVVILDEATAEGGSAGARELERAALAVTEGRTALVVAHRLTQSESADRVLVMHDGVIVEEGTHDELVAAGGRYAELWEAWSG